MRHTRSLAVIGNVLYHFDRALFGLLAPFLAPLFFPHTDPIYSLIYMYALMPLGLLSKPIGTWVFGRLVNRLGQAKVLSITLMGMATQTALSGLLPTYAQIGPLAPLFLMGARLGFNFFAAGETTGSSILLLEKTPEQRRGFVSSLFDTSGILGILLASCAVGLTSSYSEFWRFLFLGGACVGLVGWFMRRTPPENPPKEQQNYSTWKTLLQHRRALFSICSVAGFSYANYYLITTFMNGFLPLVSPLSQTQALSLNSLLLLVDALLLPLIGLLSMRIRKEKLMLIGILGVVGSSAPLFFWLQDASMLIAATVRITLTFFGVCVAAPYHAWTFENSPAQHRYLIGAMGSLLGAKLLGAPLPALALWLYKTTGWIAAPTLPVIAAGLLAALPLLKNLFTFFNSPVKRRI